MTYVQLSMLDIPAVVTRGDTIRLEFHEHWLTPAHVMDGWSFRLHRQKRMQDATEQWNGLTVPARLDFLQRHEQSLAAALKPQPPEDLIAQLEIEREAAD